METFYDPDATDFCEKCGKEVLISRFPQPWDGMCAFCRGEEKGGSMDDFDDAEEFLQYLEDAPSALFGKQQKSTDLNELLEFVKEAIRTNLVKAAVKNEDVLFKAFMKIEEYQKEHKHKNENI